MKLGEKIKLVRTEKELTQPELAEKAGIEQSYLSKVENDKAVPSFNILNRIAMALEMTGMGLIDTLSQSYVEDNLAHIPEVAAEYAAIKSKREVSLKKRFVAAAFAVVLGIGIALVGYSYLLFPENMWNYSSQGVIRNDETIFQFSTSSIREIAETQEEANERMRSNRARFDTIMLVSSRNKGISFIEKVEGGRRFYDLRGVEYSPNPFNGFVTILGVMLMAAGGFAFLFNIRFKPN